MSIMEKIINLFRITLTKKNQSYHICVHITSKSPLTKTRQVNFRKSLKIRLKKKTTISMKEMVFWGGKLNYKLTAINGVALQYIVFS